MLIPTASKIVLDLIRSRSSPPGSGAKRHSASRQDKSDAPWWPTLLGEKQSNKRAKTDQRSCYEKIHSIESTEGVLGAILIQGAPRSIGLTPYAWL